MLFTKTNPSKDAVMLIKEDLIEYLYQLGIEQVAPNKFLRSEDIEGELVFSSSADGKRIVVKMLWSDGEVDFIKSYPFY